jgi:hypothetical protein
MAAKRVEIRADSLSPEEWLFVHWYRAQQPGATMGDKLTLQKEALGLSQAQLGMKILQAEESFKARGAIIPAVDAEGRPIKHPKTGEQLSTWVGEIISVMTEIDPLKLMH